MLSRLREKWVDFTRSRSNYVPLPLADGSTSTSPWLTCNLKATTTHRRRFKVLLAGLASIVVIALLYSSKDAIKRKRIHVVDADHPPLYEDYEEMELHLPQHNPKLPYPEGAKGRYFFPANHLWGLGFNNIFQEHLMLAHLAYRVNRSFVFDPYTWHWNHDEPYGDYGGKPVPARIPWHAFLTGPAVGDSFPPDDLTPRAVRKEYYKKVCRKPTVLKSEEVDSKTEFETDALNITNTWVDAINNEANRCVEVDGNTVKHIFDFGIFMDTRLLTIYDSLVNSPILKDLAWSPLVESAITANLPLLGVPEPSYIDRLSDDFANPNPISLPGLLTLHVRRGDYEYHCSGLFGADAPIQGWQMLPGIPDRFNPPSKENMEERRTYYMDHCWPSTDKILAKVREVRETEEGRGLKSVYILSNGDREFLDGLKMAINEMGGWETISTSRDMAWTPEQKYISQAVDMAIAQRAQAFIGNPFSSMSSNVVILRFSKDKPPASNRFF